MKCSQCGLPVSPARTHCPRCGIPVEKLAAKSGPRQDAPLFLQDLSPSPAETKEEYSRQAWATQSATRLEAQPHYSNTNRAPVQMDGKPTRALEQLEFPAPSSISQSSPGLPARVAPASDSEEPQVERERELITSLRRTQINNTPSTSTFSKSTAGTRLGFTVAGLCIGTGALILIFVFIMAQVLPMYDGMPIQIAKQQVQKAAQLSIIPTLAPIPSPTLPDITPTSNTTGSKYVDDIQIGSVMNMNRLEITQATRDFKVGQRIYITMNVNRAGYQGAVCLDWYVQNSFLTHYTFPTFADPSLPHSTAWSYAASGRIGAGYVNVSWASSTACTDKVLAERVDFTIDA